MGANTEVRAALTSLLEALPLVRTAGLYGGPALLLGGVYIDQFVLNVVPRLWVDNRTTLRKGLATYVPASAGAIAESPFRRVESLALFPIFHRGRWVGFLYLDSDEPDFLPDRHWSQVVRILEPLGLITRLAGVKQRRQLRRRQRARWRKALRDLAVETVH